MKTLVFLPNWLGDILFATPCIRAIKNADPDGVVAAACPANLAQILTDNPSVDEIIRISDGRLRLIFTIRKYQFDRAILLRRSVTRSLIAGLAGIPERIGAKEKNKDLFLSRKLPPVDMLSVHRVQYYLNIARGMGLPVEDGNRLDFFISARQKKSSAELLKSEGVLPGDKYIVINPGANWEKKRWSIKSFAEVSDRLIEQTGGKVVMTGSGKDVRLACWMIKEMKNSPVILTGKTSLKMLGAIFKKASLVISNDSGPLHLARAVGAKTIALYGPTSPKITGPLGASPGEVIYKDVGCDRPCYDETCADNKCMGTISVEEVLEAASKLVSSE